MGLLSDPEYGSVKWVKIVNKVHFPLGILCYIAAIVWFCLLGNRTFNNETYFSENALLPGLVTNEFNGEASAKQIHNEFLLELESKYADTNEMPVPWLVAKMSQLGLEVYTHNFTLNYPLGKGQVFKGTNVYGILRAPRTSSLEAVVVSAPYRPLNSHLKGTTAGIALMLAFAQFARPQKYWAKDIIFLVTEHEQLGMQAWLEAYHGIVSDVETFSTSLGSFWSPGTFDWYSKGKKHEKCLNPGKLIGRSGSIQAAVNLELHSPKIKYVEVKIEGLNGQLPNLDLPNLAHKLLVKSGIYHSYKSHYSWIKTRDKMADWKEGISTILGMCATQLAGVPNGNHGLFHRFGIEAVTLEGRDEHDPAGPAPRAARLTNSNFYRLGAALESILRSLNNLLERFHQSYFFYLMAGIDRFISIGQYMPSLCLLCAAILIRALALWVEVHTTEEDEEKDKKTNSNTTNKDKTSNTVATDENIEGEKTTDEKEKTTDEKEKDKTAISDTKSKKLEQKEKETVKSKGEIKKGIENETESSMSILNVGVNCLVLHFIGSGVINTPVLLSYLGAIQYNLPPEKSVFYGFAAISVILAILSPFLLTRRPSYEELTFLNVLVLIEMATICLTVGMFNFPLGFALGVFYTPLALIAGVKQRGKKRYFVNLRRIIALLLHPLSIVMVSMLVYSKYLFVEESFMMAAARGRDAAMQAVMFAVVDSLIYGNWLFNVAACLVLPSWMIFWQLVWIKAE